MFILCFWIKIYLKIVFEPKNTDFPTTSKRGGGSRIRKYRIICIFLKKSARHVAHTLKNNNIDPIVWA
jgi:hypothetical protein